MIYLDQIRPGEAPTPTVKAATQHTHVSADPVIPMWRGKPTRLQTEAREVRFPLVYPIPQGAQLRDGGFPPPPDRPDSCPWGIPFPLRTDLLSRQGTSSVGGVRAAIRRGSYRDTISRPGVFARFLSRGVHEELAQGRACCSAGAGADGEV